MLNSEYKPDYYQKFFMTAQNRIPFSIYQRYFEAKDSLNSFINKIEVITDSNAIIYSIRILIVMIALLMGYIHTSNETPNMATIQQKEILGNHQKAIFKNIN